MKKIWKKGNAREDSSTWRSYINSPKFV
jgi:hypothetical protein